MANKQKSAVELANMMRRRLNEIAAFDERIKALEAELAAARKRILELEGKQKEARPAKAKQPKPAKPAKTALAWNEDGKPSNIDGQVRSTFVADAGRGEYRIAPAYDLITMRFAGYAVDHHPDRDWRSLRPKERRAALKNRRVVESGLRTPEDAKAVAERDYERLAGG
jgi:hypothetical protein